MVFYYCFSHHYHDTSENLLKLATYIVWVVFHSRRPRRALVRKLSKRKPSKRKLSRIPQQKSEKHHRKKSQQLHRRKSKPPRKLRKRPKQRPEEVPDCGRNLKGLSRCEVHPYKEGPTVNFEVLYQRGVHFEHYDRDRKGP